MRGPWNLMHTQPAAEQTLAWSLRVDDCCCWLFSSSFSYKLHHM